jgi:ubiquinone/menaquinone biosynthesis C-methylase UbiE
MNNKETVKAGYNKIANAYLATRSEFSEDVRLLDNLAQKLTKGDRILDAGCGAGVPVTRFLCQSFRVIGADFAEVQVKLAHQLVPQAQFVCQDITKLGFQDDTFNAICSYYAIIHIPRKAHEEIFQSFYRLLKPFGWILLCLGAEDLEEDIVEDYLGARMYCSHFDAETNIRLIRKSGFEIIVSTVVADSTSPGSGHLFVLAQKKRA